MTPPENDLRDAVAGILLRELIVRRGYDSVGRAADWIDGKNIAVDRILSGPLAKARADLERVTAERDEARKDAEGWKIEAEHFVHRANSHEAELDRLRPLEAEKVRDHRLSDRLAEARATNQRLHRRLQAVEGPMQSRLHFQKWLLDYRFRAFARVRRRALVAEAENTRLRALLVDAGEALRPLADAAGHHEHTHDDACVIAIPGRPGRDQPRVGQLRRARSTLAALDKAPTPKEPSDV